MMAPKPARPASPPFDEPGADIILRSSDDVVFRVYKNILSLASPFFKDLFSLPQPSPTAIDNTTSGEIPVIPVTEDAETLDFMLRSIYPVRSPKIKKLSDLRFVFEASRKYQIETFDGVAEESLMGAVEQDPVSVYALAPRLNAPPFGLPTLDVALGVIIHPQTHESQADAEALDRVHVLVKPYERHADNGNALYERRDGVGDGRHGGEDDERDDVLGEMDGAVSEEVVRYRMRRIMSVRGMRDVSRLRSGQQHAKVGIQPDRDHEEERHERGVEKQIQFVEFVMRVCLSTSGHHLLEEDVGRDKNQGGAKGAEQANGIRGGDVERAS
ncbi:hypothetical protein EW146_g5611 [Bondarzewia mesenterica]|uniref:BTB domain-containing protein n=1 Tax=Bondarzewia mesenterica TaxID=1095465 RepID=A0A4S4LQY5_9AGAM|nr:hypothetical protein EW146_g5611 [Bondarzewia mesenterica]